MNGAITQPLDPAILDHASRTDLKQNGRPFFYAAADGNKDVIVFLVHGFSGSPYDLSELGKYLSEHNINACGVLLAGHGGDYAVFAPTGHREWWQSVKLEIDRYQGDYQHIILMGYSFGSNLVMDIACRYPELAEGVICMSPSVFIRKHNRVRFLNAVFSLFTDHVDKRKMRRDRRALYEAGGRHITVSTHGLSSFFEFIDNYTKRQLPLFSAPILLIHSRDDYASNPRSSEYIFEKIASTDKELFMINEFEHNPLNSNSRNVIFGKILEFIAEHRQ